MKQLLAIVVFGVFVCASYVYAQDKAADKSKEAAKETMISGEVVDVSCYLRSGAKGEKHKACAEACAEAGSALGILADDGTLYVSVLPDDHKSGPNAILMGHIAHHVKVTGQVRSKGGVNGIMISKVEMAKGEK
jgi:hypothetical protein